MKAFLVRELLKPLSRRLGTAAAAILIAKGVDPDIVSQIVAGVTALMFVCADLILSATSRLKEGD